MQTNVDNDLDLQVFGAFQKDTLTFGNSNKNSF